ncbi:MAG TPA: hypothetical protein VEQ65_04150, partial [Opitutus sp.]|nr:hypothetical protein [Opitutus sp.]
MIPQRCSLLFTSSLLFFSAAFAADPKEIDLDRIEPVPATETIPIADFFRPRLLQSPRLNPSGTLVAALVTTGEDRRELLVHDLEKKSSYTLRGSGDKDIYTFTWLSDNRLVYMLSTQKLYGLGLMALDTGRSRKSYPLLQYAGAHLVSVPRKNRERPLVWMRSDVFDGRDLGVAVINTALNTGPMVDLSVAD